MLAEDLSGADRALVKRSIDHLRRGDSAARIRQARVVGVRRLLCAHSQVTCAASAFACLDSLRFPLLLLDECCQMTEPAALLPLARWVLGVFVRLIV